MSGPHPTRTLAGRKSLQRLSRCCTRWKRLTYSCTLPCSVWHKAAPKGAAMDAGTARFRAHCQSSAAIQVATGPVQLPTSGRGPAHQLPCPPVPRSLARCSASLQSAKLTATPGVTPAHRGISLQPGQLAAAVEQLAHGVVPNVRHTEGVHHLRHEAGMRAATVLQPQGGFAVGRAERKAQRLCRALPALAPLSITSGAGGSSSCGCDGATHLHHVLRRRPPLHRLHHSLQQLCAHPPLIGSWRGTGGNQKHHFGRGAG